MTNELTNHEELRALLPDAALDLLDAPERAALDEHLRSCAACADELRDLRDAAAGLAYAVPTRPMDAARSAGVRARLLARAAAAPRADDGPAVIPFPVGWRVPRRGSAPVAWIGWLAAAAAVVLLVLTGTRLNREQARADRLATELRRARAAEQSLNARLARGEALLAGLTAEGVQVISLASTGPRPPSARMFWNPRTNTWTFFAHRLPPVPAGRAYQLWLVTPGRKISAGTFTPAPGGRAVVQAEYALPPDSLRAVAVTQEPEGGVPQPTGPVIVAGAAR